MKTPDEERCPSCKQIYLGGGLCPVCSKVKPLSQLQAEIGGWSLANFGMQISRLTGQALYSLAPLLGIMEELGELCHAVLKAHQGIRGHEDLDEYHRDRDDAIGDLCIFLCDFCSREGVDLAAVIAKTWEEVSKRDWKGNPQDGSMETLPCGCTIPGGYTCPIHPRPEDDAS